MRKGRLFWLMHAALLALLACAVMPFLLLKPEAAQATWIGKIIYPLQGKIWVTPSLDDQRKIATLDAMEYRVLAEEDGWLESTTGTQTVLNSR